MALVLTEGSNTKVYKNTSVLVIEKYEKSKYQLEILHWGLRLQ